MSAVVHAASDRDVARSVLGTEAAGLRALAASLDDSFDRAVALLAGCRGRIAVSGMGKSGHVARKTAATLASTGSPAFFVHPAEASHGDLGMVQPADALLLFSNSGETTELADLVAHCPPLRPAAGGGDRARRLDPGERGRCRAAAAAAPEACTSPPPRPPARPCSWPLATRSPWCC